MQLKNNLNVNILKEINIMSDTNYQDFEQPMLPLKEFEEMDDKENEASNAQPTQITKILTLILDSDQELHINLITEHFENSSEDEIKTIVSRILQNASLKTLDESKAFMEDEEWSNFKTPINNGSLYDEIIFESSIYVDNNHEIVPNTSFGKQCDPSVPLHINLRQVSDALLYVANDFRDLESLNINEEEEYIPEESNAIDNLNVDNSVKGRF